MPVCGFRFTCICGRFGQLTIQRHHVWFASPFCCLSQFALVRKGRRRDGYLHSPRTIGIHGKRIQDGYESGDEQWNLPRRRSGMGQLWMVCHRATHPHGQRIDRFGRLWKWQSIFKPAEERRVDGLCSAASGFRHLFKLHSNRVERKMVVDTECFFHLHGWDCHQIQLCGR